MKARKNKKRIDPRYHLSETIDQIEEESNDVRKQRMKDFHDFSFDSWLNENKKPKPRDKKPFPGGTSEDLPKEVPDNDPQTQANADAVRNEGGCGSETPLPALTQGPENLTPDEAYDTGYADAVEEIMNSISHLIHEPVGEPVAIEINEEDEEKQIDKQLLDDFKKALRQIKASDPDVDLDYLIYHLDGERDNMSSSETIWADTDLGSASTEEMEQLYNYLTQHRDKMNEMQVHAHAVENPTYSSDPSKWEISLDGVPGAGVLTVSADAAGQEAVISLLNPYFESGRLDGLDDKRIEMPQELRAALQDYFLEEDVQAEG